MYPQLACCTLLSSDTT